MRLEQVTPGPPAAFRVLVQGADDAAPIDFSLSVAAAWTDAPILVVNATGRDLSAFGSRYRLVEIRDDDGRPSRSLTEIVGVLEQLDHGAFGACVVLDANRLYRATRCAVRDAKQIENLSSGQWDGTNEALGEFGERLTRLGLPSVFYAPPTDVYGLDAQGEQTVVGTKAQAWKDLPRTAHLYVGLSRSGQDQVVEVLGDDWGALGRPGTMIVGATGRGVGDATTELARGARAGAVGGTTLAEASAAELAARARRVEARRRRSGEVRTRLLNLAELRAQQGRWDEFVAELNSSVAELDPDDFEQVSKRTDQVLAKRGELIDWMRAAEADLERNLTRTLHELRPGGVVGPSTAESPARDDMPVEQLLSTPPGVAAHQIRDCAREDIASWVASLAQYACVWSEPSFAAVCLGCSVPPRGPSWESYSDDELRRVALYCLSLAQTRYHCDRHVAGAERPRLRAVESEAGPPTRGEGVRQIAVAAVPDPFELPEHVEASPVSGQEPGPARLTVDLPTPAEFNDLDRPVATDYLNALLLAGGWRDRIEELLAEADICPQRPQATQTWTRTERFAAYQVLLARADQRLAS